MKIIVLTLIFLSACFIFDLDAQNLAEQKSKLADTYLKSGDFKNASRVYEELFNEFPNNSNYFDGLVSSFKIMNRFSELLPYAKVFFEKNKSASVYALIGELLWRTGSTNDANEIWEDAISKYKKNQDIYVLISNAQVQLQLYDKAIATLIKGRENLSNPLSFSDALSRLYIATGNYQKGLSEVLNLLSADGNLSVAQGRIYALISTEDSQQYILNQLKIKSEENRDNIIFQELFAWYLRTINRLDQALDVFVNIDRLKRANGAELIRFGEDSRRDGQFDIAIKAFNIIIKMGKSNPYIHSALYGFARTMEQKMLSGKTINKEDAEDIIEKYESIIKDFNNTQQALESRLRIAEISLNYLNDKDRAVKELNLAIKENRNMQISGEAAIMLSKIFLYDGDFARSRALLSETDKKFRSSMPVFANRAKLLLADITFYEGLIDSALTQYANLSIAPETDIANSALNMIIVIEQNKQYTKALVEYAKADFEFVRKEYIKAVELFSIAAETSSGTDLAELCLKRISDIHFASSSYNECINVLTKLLNEYPETLYGDYALQVLGDSYASLGNKDEAMKNYTDLLTKFPKSIYLNEVRKKIRTLRGEQL